jgi:hypothetical protein
MSYGAKVGVGLIAVVAIVAAVFGLARFGTKDEPGVSGEASREKRETKSSGEAAVNGGDAILRLKEIDKESAALSRRIFMVKKEAKRTETRALALQSEISEKRKALESRRGQQPEVVEKRGELERLFAEARELAENMGSGSGQTEEVAGKDRLASLLESARDLTVELRRMERDALNDDSEASLLLDSIFEKQAELEALLDELPVVRASRERQTELAAEARKLRGEEDSAAGNEKKNVATETSI